MYQRSLSFSQGDAIGITLLVIADVFLGLATLAVGIRLWSRKIQRYTLVLNDYAAILGWVFAASLVVNFNIAIVRGEHAQMDPADIANSLKAYIASDAVWAAANTSIKISIVHLYITIFGSNRTFLMIAYAVMVLLSAFGVAVVIDDLLACRPLSKMWKPLQPGVCENPFVSLVALSSCNMATDLILILLPMPMIWGLQMATRRKIGLTIIFALGLIVCIATIIRLVSSTRTKFHGYTYFVPTISIPTILEPLLGIIIACLPIFPPAFKKLMGRTKKTAHPQTRRKVLPSSMARMRLKRLMRSSTLQSSSDDSSPLTDLDVEARGTQNHITGPSSGKDDYIFESYDGRYTGIKIPPQSYSIMVERDLEVRSDEVK